MKLHIKKIKPLFTGIVTTAEHFEETFTTKNGIGVYRKGDLKPWQRVVAVGSTVRDIEVGDSVMINLDNYAVRKYSAESIKNDLEANSVVRHQYNFVDLDNSEGETQQCLFICDRDVMYVFEGEEEADKIVAVEKPGLII